MKEINLYEKADKIVTLKSDDVIQALANYLADKNMIDDFETNGTMVYKMNNDASITIELNFDKPTVQ
jgi:hypothetical protein|tara:strand:- start:129 stop:329 length:201 start_codon:yes stop_codon:yes gene_type:complete